MLNQHVLFLLNNQPNTNTILNAINGTLLTPIDKVPIDKVSKVTREEASVKHATSSDIN